MARRGALRGAPGSQVCRKNKVVDLTTWTPKEEMDPKVLEGLLNDDTAAVAWEDETGAILDLISEAEDTSIDSDDDVDFQ
jgi:hypothetical protein